MKKKTVSSSFFAMIFMERLLKYSLYMEKHIEKRSFDRSISLWQKLIKYWLWYNCCHLIPHNTVCACVSFYLSLESTTANHRHKLLLLLLANPSSFLGWEQSFFFFVAKKNKTLSRRFFMSRLTKQCEPITMYVFVNRTQNRKGRRFWFPTQMNDSNFHKKIK